tara:strand:+ start:321 stop:656 length:336 start_codon:yes stop_codon:yes gene_type:complete
MIKKLYKNFLNSLNGLKVVFKENSFKLEILLGLFLVPYILFSNNELILKIILSILYLLLLAFEIMNTSIEKLCDKITKDLDDDIKKIKDLSSASVFAVLITLFAILIISLF